MPTLVDVPFVFITGISVLANVHTVQLGNCFKKWNQLKKQNKTKQNASFKSSCDANPLADAKTHHAVSEYCRLVELTQHDDVCVFFISVGG